MCPAHLLLPRPPHMGMQVNHSKKERQEDKRKEQKRRKEREKKRRKEEKKGRNPLRWFGFDLQDGGVTSALSNLTPVQQQHGFVCLAFWYLYFTLDLSTFFYPIECSSALICFSKEII